MDWGDEGRRLGPEGEIGVEEGKLIGTLALKPDFELIGVAWRHEMGGHDFIINARVNRLNWGLGDLHGGEGDGFGEGARKVLVERTASFRKDGGVYMRYYGRAVILHEGMLGEDIETAVSWRSGGGLREQRGSVSGVKAEISHAMVAICEGIPW